MARLILPEDFLLEKLLSKKIKEKHDSYPIGTSPIEAFMVQHGISLTNDETAISNADDSENKRSEKSKEATDLNQKRDLLWDPVFKRMRDEHQFLKKFYKPNFLEIGNWGAPITVTGRINYPPDYPNRTIIFENLKTKYDTFLPPGSSPLDPYLTQHQITLIDDESRMTASRTHALNAIDAAKEAEDHTQDRNNFMSPVKEHQRMIGDFLMGLYNDNPNQLGYWGYVVDNSPKAPKQVVSKVLLNSHKTVNAVIIGGTFKNIGSVALTVHKGKTASSPGVTVLPGETYGIAKGFSTITIINPSTTTTGVFSALRSQ